MSACAINDCLYVTDSGNSCVWRITKLVEKNGGVGGKVDKWLTGVGWPYKTSTTIEGSVCSLHL